MSYYKDGTISIPNVTGDIVITATAVQGAVVNQIRNAIKADGTPYNGGLGYSNLGRRIKSDGSETSGTSVEYVTGFILLDKSKQIYFNHAQYEYISGKSNSGVLASWYDASFNFIKSIALSANNLLPSPYTNGAKELYNGEVPSNASYLRFTSFENNGLTRDMVEITFE